MNKYCRHISAGDTFPNQHGCVSATVLHPSLIVKTHKKYFHVITFFGQCIYFTTIAFCSCEHGTKKICNSLSNNQQTSVIQQRELCSSKCAYINKNDSNDHLHNCISGVLNIKIEIVKNILANSQRRRARACNCSDFTS